METQWLTAQVELRETTWAELRQGDRVYYHEAKYRDARAYGPFTVVDPEKFVLKNRSDVEFVLPDIRLLRIV